jgi:hypothetical protein
MRSCGGQPVLRVCVIAGLSGGVRSFCALGRSEHGDAGWYRWWLVGRGFGRSLFRGAVRPVLVVVAEVADDEVFDVDGRRHRLPYRLLPLSEGNGHSRATLLAALGE